MNAAGIGPGTSQRAALADRIGIFAVVSRCRRQDGRYQYQKSDDGWKAHHCFSAGLNSKYGAARTLHQGQTVGMKDEEFHSDFM